MVTSTRACGRGRTIRSVVPPKTGCAAAAPGRTAASLAARATAPDTEEGGPPGGNRAPSGARKAPPPVPAGAAVGGSGGPQGDTKTEKPRRPLALPQMAADALRAHKEKQAARRLAAGALRSEQDLVFATRSGATLDAANVRREFRAVCKAANIQEHWTPRDLRHSFVSLMSTSGVPVEEIARLRGHPRSRPPDEVYRRE